MAFAWLRAPFRRLFFRFLGRVWGTDEARVLAIQALRGLLAERPELPPVQSSEPPYPDLGVAAPSGLTCQRSDIVILTARFRSGSTLLWNLFRHLDGFTSYYEPLNERRWFDPQQRGTRIDPTHRGVSDYWAEYEGLTELADLYDERWIERELYMGPHAWNPALKRYVEVLVERAKGRAALQFNRIDFRLPWFRRTFPNARIVHLYRHPRDQWLSTLAGPSRNFPRNGSLTDFAAHDHYYLLNWCRDLRHHFPI